MGVGAFFTKLRQKLSCKRSVAIRDLETQGGSVATATTTTRYTQEANERRDWHHPEAQGGRGDAAWAEIDTQNVGDLFGPPVRKESAAQSAEKKKKAGDVTRGLKKDVSQASTKLGD